MPPFIYLSRKGDLFKISHTKNLDKEIREIKPDEVIAKMEIKEPEVFEARLYKRYKKERLPGSDYFRLTEEQVNDCKKQLGDKSQLPKVIGKECSITATSAVLLFLAVFYTTGFLKIGFLRTLSISLASSSISFWVLFILGNFGGYDSKDLPLFSSWGNRSKAFFLAMILTSISIFLFPFS